MTSTFKESPTNDFTFDTRGALCIVSGADAVQSDARSAIQAQRGEMVLAMTEGMPTLQTAWEAYRPGQFEAAARAVILRVPGVRSVPVVTVRRVGHELRYDATIQSEFGPVILRG